MTLTTLQIIAEVLLDSSALVPEPSGSLLVMLPIKNLSREGGGQCLCACVCVCVCVDLSSRVGEEGKTSHSSWTWVGGLNRQ